MKPFLLSCLFLCLSTTVFAQFSVSGMAKKHENRADNFPDRPYGDDDISYGVFMDIFDGPGAWRIGASYATDLSGPGEADSVITPEITLLGTDGIYEGGISVLIDYVDAGGEADWGDVYFQTQLGLNFPVSRGVSIGIHAFYPIDDFSNLDFSDLDYAATVRIKF